MRPDELKRRLQDSTLSRRPRRALHVLMLPDLERAERIGELWSYLQSRTFAELLIDCEETPDAPSGARRDVAGG